MSERDWPTAVFRKDGERLELHARVGEGGEGRVFHVGGHSDWVVKLPKTKSDGSSYDFEKLSALIAMSCPELLQVAAWPLDLVYDESGQPIGYVMEHLAGFTPIYSAYQIRTRQNRLPGWSYQHLLRTARNLSACLATLHKRGIIVGDLNESNVLVSPGSKVMLIDADSFQIEANGKTYSPEVARTEYLPPELQNKNLTGVRRTEHGDNFSMAILVFQTLLFGRHPYAGRPESGDDDDIPLELAISQGWFAYSNQRYVPQLPPHHTSLQMLPQRLHALFESTFEPDGLRPSADTWYEALLASESEIQSCTASKSHFFIGTECPWCRLESVWKSPLFIQTELQSPKMAVPDPFPSAVLFEISQFQGIFSALPTPEKFIQRTVVPRPWWRLFHNGITNHILASTAFIYGTPLLSVMGLPLHVSLVVSMSAVFACYAPSLIVQIRSLPMKRKYRAFLRQWESTASIKRIEAHRAKLVDLMSKLSHLDHETNARRMALLRERFPEHVRQYLSRYSIAGASVSTDGQARIDNLIKRGLRTAADVSAERIEKLMPRSPAIADLLIRWAHELERVFWEKSNLSIDPILEREIQAEYTERRSAFVAEYEQELAEYNQTIAQVRTNQRDLLSVYAQLSVEILECAQTNALAGSQALLPKNARTQRA